MMCLYCVCVLTPAGYTPVLFCLHVPLCDQQHGVWLCWLSSIVSSSGTGAVHQKTAAGIVLVAQENRLILSFLFSVFTDAQLVRTPC
jgi:hypothetical protein